MKEARRLILIGFLLCAVAILQGLALTIRHYKTKNATTFSTVGDIR